MEWPEIHFDSKWHRLLESPTRQRDFPSEAGNTPPFFQEVSDRIHRTARHSFLDLSRELSRIVPQSDQILPPFSQYVNIFVSWSFLELLAQVSPFLKPLEGESQLGR